MMNWSGLVQDGDFERGPLERPRMNRKDHITGRIFIRLSYSGLIFFNYCIFLGN